MIVHVTCNDEPLRYDPPGDYLRPKNTIDQNFEDTAAKGFDDLAMAMAYAHVHASYAVSRSKIPVTWIPLDINDPSGGISWQEAGPGRWEMRLGPLLYVARVAEGYHG